MADKTYRFLLRMPEQLRQKLLASAQQQGRSLNSSSSTVSEESLDQGSNAGCVRRLRDRLASVHAHQTEGEQSLRANPARDRPRGRLALVCTAVVAGSSAATRARRRLREARARREELPAALARKMAKSATFSPTTTAKAARPSTTARRTTTSMRTPLRRFRCAAIEGSRNDWKKMKGHGFDGDTLGGRWLSLGPDNAIYPFNPFRNRFAYVPNEYAAAGRTTHSLIDPDCGVEAGRTAGSGSRTRAAASGGRSTRSRRSRSGSTCRPTST